MSFRFHSDDKFIAYKNLGLKISKEKDNQGRDRHKYEDNNEIRFPRKECVAVNTVMKFWVL
jgi:hypothetical protein